MSGGVKVVIQEENGTIHNLFPYHSALPDWFIHPDFLSLDPLKRKARLDFILKEWAETLTQMQADNDDLSKGMIESCRNSAPDWYGICFISFKHLVAVNLQSGSSITSAVVSIQDGPERTADFVNLRLLPKEALTDPDFVFPSEIVQVPKGPWFMVDHLDVKKYKNIGKAIMKSCGVKFTPEENQLWKEFKFR